MLGAGYTMASALDGITVLDLTDSPAGAQTTMLLGDHGARVMRVVDTHDTAPRRGGYLVWDRGKQCIRLALARLAPPAQRRRSHAPETPTASQDPNGFFEHLIRHADVLVESFAPASPRQATVPFDWLSALNPRLVHCSI